MTVPAPQAMYLGPAERPVFAWLHGAPPPSGSLGLVIVPPFGYEAVCAHQALRRLAIDAATHGITAVRLDLDGTGDSAGDDLDPDRVGRWIASIGQAVDLARAQGADRVVLCGVRLGALLATVAAEGRADIAGVVAIAPVVSGRRWLREMKALQQALGLAERPADRAVAPGGDDVQEVIGFAVTAETRAQLTAIELDKRPARPAPAVLVIDRDDLPPSSAWIAHLRGQGVAVDARQLPGYVEMVLDPHKAVTPAAILAEAMTWIRARPQLTPRAPAAQAPRTARTMTLGAITEEPITIDGAGTPLAAIATRPAGSPKDALVLLNAGAVRRIGPNRLHVPLARRLAARGTLVVRVDLSGIGDSDPLAGHDERSVYHDHALAEVASILAWCHGQGAPRALVSGLCSGGYYALWSAAAGAAWHGIIPVNPGEPGTGIDDKPYQATQDTERYKQSMRSFASWKRLVTGDVDLRHLARNLQKRAAGVIEARAKDAARRLGMHVKGDVGSELAALARRGVALTFVFCGDEPGLVLFRERIGTTGPRLEAKGALAVRIVDGPDHTYTPRWSHEILLGEIERAMRSRA